MPRNKDTSLLPLLSLNLSFTVPLSSPPASGSPWLPAHCPSGAAGPGTVQDACWARAPRGALERAAV